MKDNNLTDKELKAIFAKQKRSYDDPLFKQKVMQKIGYFGTNPLNRILLTSAFLYFAGLILLFSQGLQEWMREWITELIPQMNTGYFNLYLIGGYMLLMLFLLVRIIQLIYSDSVKR